jgi:hypothetical protein
VIDVQDRLIDTIAKHEATVVNIKALTGAASYTQWVPSAPLGVEKDYRRNVTLHRIHVRTNEAAPG